MEGPANKSFTLKPSPSPTPSQSGESNENELNHDELCSKLSQTPKKSATKHFMSPTISAATKARKKILTERNESADPNTPRFDSTNWDAKPRFVRSSSSRVTPSQSVASDDDEHQEICASDSSMKPYDPVTSYTSPRPKFLRYNPNRSVSQIQTLREDLGFDARRKMCFDSQKVADELRAIASSTKSRRKEGGKSNANQHSNLKEGDDADEVRSIVSSPESPRKGEEDDDADDDLTEDIEKKGWNLKEMLELLLVVAVLFISTHYISSMNSSIPSPTVLAFRGIKNGYYGVQNKVFEAVNLKILQGLDADVELVENRAEDEGKGPVEGGEEYVQVEDQPENVRVEEDVQVEDQPENVHVEEHVQVEDLSEKDMGTTSEVFDQVVEVTEIVEDEFDQELESEVEESDHLVDEDLSDIKAGVFGDQEIENTIKGSVELLDTHSIGVFQRESLDTETVVVEDVAANEIEIVEEINSRNEDELDTTDSLNPDLKNATIEPQETESLLVPIFFSLVASLGLVYLWKHKKNSVESEMPATQIHEVRSVVEQVSLIDAEPENRNMKVEFKAKPPVLIRSIEAEISGDFGQSQAPIVELLSELVIGDVKSSHQSKFSYTADSYSDEFSTAESQSYGSFSTPMKKASKKTIDEGATPVRRSSRIRNRAMMSP